MSNFVIAFLVAISGGTWVYSKAYKQTGGNTKTSIIVGALVGAVALLVMWTGMGIVFN